MEIKKILKSFIIKAAITFVAWMVLYYGFILPEGSINTFLTSAVLDNTVMVLECLGYSASNSGNIVYVDGQQSVKVTDGCNGFELIALYIGFFLCFPGPLKYKLIFIPIGSVVIFFINVIREVALVLNYNYFQKTFDFNHHYTYAFFVYAVVFLIWRFWLNNYSIIGKRIQNEPY